MDSGVGGRQRWIDTGDAVAQRIAASATREDCERKQQTNSLHASIEPESPRQIDTRLWVFSGRSPALMLESMGAKVRWILVAALGGLLLLIAITGAAAMVILHRLQTGEAAQRARLVERGAWMNRVENGVYLSGTLARDYVAEPASADAPALLARLSQLEEESKQAVTTVALHGEVLAYWRLLDLMLEMARKTERPGVDAYFRRQLAERRENMLHIAGEINAARDLEWRQGENELTETYARFRWMLAAELALVVVLGLVLSVGAARRLLLLESQTRSLSAQLEQAQEAERRSIARELHDEIGQAVSGLVLDVGRAASTAGSAAVRAQLAAIGETGERIAEAVRRMALSLRPSMLDDLGLVAALEWQAREVGNRTGLHVEVCAEDSAGEMPDAQRTCIFRVSQEALQNAARHSGASLVRVGLAQSAGTVSLLVEDNGRGFRAGRTRGLGLLGMEERVARLHGRFRVKSEPGRGTTLSVELPL
jgi:signal transduction histidine kinase